MGIYDLFYCFLVYGFLGWLMETVICSAKEARFVNRGFLNGPLCPIYGFGMIIILLFLDNHKNNPALLFIGGVFLASLLEYATGFLLETIFQTRWWDYSRKKFNIKGRVCLETSLAWGVLSVIMVTFVQPRILYLVELIPMSAGRVALPVLVATFIADAIATTLSVVSLNNRLDRMQQLQRQIRNHVTSVSIYSSANEMIKALNMWHDEFISETRIKLEYTPFEHLVFSNDEFKQKFEQFHDRYINLRNRRNIIHQRLISAFPAMRPKNFSDSFDELKRHFKRF